MANKRISELNVLTDPASGDLLLVADITAQESKKLTLGDLSGYILAGGNLSGSLNGTASWAYNAKTSSYIALVETASYAKTASYVLNNSAITPGASYDITSSWASSSLSSSLAQTASYVGLAVNSISSSWSTRSLFCLTASLLYYSAGVSNGTASYTLLAESVKSASFASSSISSSYLSYPNNSTSSNAVTASYAIQAGNSATSDYASSANIASTAISANNGVLFRSASFFYELQTGTGGSESSPNNITGSMITASASKNGTTFLINMCIAVGGKTSVGLWKSSSAGDEPLISKICNVELGANEMGMISTTYMDDLPGASLNDVFYYRGRVFPHDTGPFVVNGDSGVTRFGTSSISVIEF